MTNNSITIRLAPKDIEQIDNKVEEGYFTSRSDMIRTSVRHYINELGNIPPVIEEMGRKADEKKITKDKIVKAARKARKQVYREEYGND
jgi:Arc/MetJ-type ribon-helix-helix transcriptional regulator